MANQLTNVVTGEVRLSYVHLTKPYSMTGDPKDEKYSVTCLLPKSDVMTKQRLDAAIETAKQIGVQSKWDGAMPPVVPTPIHDGDGVKQDGTAFGPECKGHWVFSASTRPDRKPEVVDAQLQPIINASDIYSGMYARVSINVAAYKFGGKKGIGFYLGPVQKTRDGEVLGGGQISAAQAFGNLPPLPTDANGFVQTGVHPVTGQPINPVTGEPIPFQ